ncbi:MAG TPA: tetratricopeptide repeat protein [Magnetospirillaceae bacterium]|nr:tetratricopeptide repeat protein [Magnetospirillaceae bacterium]
MRSVPRFLVYVGLIIVSFSAWSQDPAPDQPIPEPPQMDTYTPAPVPAVQEPAPYIAPAPAPSLAPVPETLPARVDALELFRRGRAQESAGRIAEAQALYRQAVDACERELAADPSRMDAYAVKSWSLLRLGRHREAVDTAQAGLRVRGDARLWQVMGEAYFHLGDNELALRNLRRYLENVGEFGDRVSSTYFYMGEVYMRLRRFNHADIVYSLAVHRDPAMPRWWFRLGQAVEALADYRRAAEHYSRALSLSPGMREATEALARVRARITP